MCFSQAGQTAPTSCREGHCHDDKVQGPSHVAALGHASWVQRVASAAAAAAGAPCTDDQLAGQLRAGDAVALADGHTRIAE